MSTSLQELFSWTENSQCLSSGLRLRRSQGRRTKGGTMGTQRSLNSQPKSRRTVGACQEKQKCHMDSQADGQRIVPLPRNFSWKQNLKVASHCHEVFQGLRLRHFVVPGGKNVHKLINVSEHRATIQQKVAAVACLGGEPCIEGRCCGYQSPPFGLEYDSGCRQ